MHWYILEQLYSTLIELWKQKPVDGGGRPPISQRVLAYSLKPPRSGSDWFRKDPSVFRVIRNNR